MPGLVFEIFEVELQNVLYNLYDPVYLPEPNLFPVFQLDPGQGLDSLRAKIVTEIEGLKSSTGYPQPTKSDLLYEILTSRFIRGLSQEKAAEQLGLSTRHLRRKQNEAIHALATRVWHTHLALEEPASPVEVPSAPVIGENDSWTELMTREMEVLHKNAPETGADSADLLRRVVALAAYLPDNDQIDLVVAQAQAVIKIPVHPTVLQQMMLTLIGHILNTGYRGQVLLACSEDAESVSVCLELKGQPQPVLNLEPILALASVLGAKLDTQQDGANFTIRLIFQKVRRVSVLVVDDNSQVVQLYQRYTTNTRYDIAHVTSGAGLLERLAVAPADILMIDILLPDIDGWELLLQLRQNPTTASTPVIICSVLGNEEMAQTLGASRYLSKPIHRRSLLTALDEISASRW